MKKLILFTLIAFAFFGCNVNLKENQKEISAVDTIQIFPRGELITDENFKGKAWLKTLVTDKENFDLTVSMLNSNRARETTGIPTWRTNFMG